MSVSERRYTTRGSRIGASEVAMVLSWVVEGRTQRDEQKLRAGAREGIREWGVKGGSDDRGFMHQRLQLESRQ